jgi:yecA family protein
MRHNAISTTLSTRPGGFEPLFLRKRDGEVDPRPWCMGFQAAMNLRLSAWSRLLNENADEYRFLLPILRHCVDREGHPTIDLKRRNLTEPKSAEEALRDIPPAVEAMRQFWMPTRFNCGA